MYHLSSQGLSQQVDNQIISKNVNFNQIIEYFHLNEIPMTSHKHTLPFIYMYINTLLWLLFEYIRYIPLEK